MSVTMKRISLARYLDKKKSVARYIQKENVDVVVYGQRGPVALLMSSSVQQGHRSPYGAGDARARRMALAASVADGGPSIRRIFNRGGVWEVDPKVIGSGRRRSRLGESAKRFSLGGLWNLAKVSSLLFFLSHKS